jgi:hypothetical protein
LERVVTACVVRLRQKGVLLAAMRQPMHSGVSSNPLNFAGEGTLACQLLSNRSEGDKQNRRIES